MSGRGSSNTNERGNTADRRRRRQWLYDTFGDGKSAPCFGCGVQLDDSNLTIDRIVPGHLGGRYIRDNIRPACLPCNVDAYQASRAYSAQLEHEAAAEPLEPDELAAAYAAWKESA